MNKLKQRRKLEGLCADCGKVPPRPNRVNCTECGRKAAAATARAYRRRTAAYAPRLECCVIGPKTLCGFRMARDLPEPQEEIFTGVLVPAPRYFVTLEGGNKPVPKKPKPKPLSQPSDCPAKYTVWLIGYSPTNRQTLHKKLGVRFDTEEDACNYMKSVKLTGDWINWKVSME